MLSMPGITRNPYADMAVPTFCAFLGMGVLPTVLIEALAVGVPVVATDCVSGPREILQDGRCGAGR